jgi:hypothetical protein
MAADLVEVYKEIRRIAGRFDPAVLERDRQEEYQRDKVHLKRSGVPVYCMSLDTPDGGVGGRITLQTPYIAAENFITGGIARARRKRSAPTKQSRLSGAR